MDNGKTGVFISEQRKKMGFTQKDLAKLLHVSDRTISKWERGAGFPGVDLLEPLAQTLEVSVLDLLRGEFCQETNVHAAVSTTLSTLQENSKQDRRERRKAMLECVVILLGFLLLLSYFSFLRIPVYRTVPAGVYENGIQIAITQVRLEGFTVLQIPYGLEYWGRIKVPLSPFSMDDDMKLTFKIHISPGEQAHPRSRSAHSNGLTPIEGLRIGRDFCLTPLMNEFAFCLDDGTVIATSPALYQQFAEIYNQKVILV